MTRSPLPKSSSSKSRRLSKNPRPGRSTQLDRSRRAAAARDQRRARALRRTHSPSRSWKKKSSSIGIRPSTPRCGRRCRTFIARKGDILAELLQPFVQTAKVMPMVEPPVAWSEMQTDTDLIVVEDDPVTIAGPRTAPRGRIGKSIRSCSPSYAAAKAIHRRNSLADALLV